MRLAMVLSCLCGRGFGFRLAPPLSQDLRFGNGASAQLSSTIGQRTKQASYSTAISRRGGVFCARQSIAMKSAASTEEGEKKVGIGRRLWKFLRRGRRGSVVSPQPPDVQVAIIGAGIAGLICARALTQAGMEVRVFEASDGVGGRVRTDVVDGFLLDRGFQVFIEEYPEVRRQLNYEELQLSPFAPGALVRCEGGFHLVADPLRRPQDILRAVVSPVGSLVDKIKVGLYRLSIGGSSLDSIFAARETDTRSFLEQVLGLGPEMVERFFVPFYRGIFLAPLEQQSSTMFQFVFKMFADGSASLPAAGIGAVTQQIAEALPEGVVLLNSPVLRVIPAGSRLITGETTGAAGKTAESAGGGGRWPVLQLLNGTTVTCGAAVVATEAPAAAALLDGTGETAKAAVSSVAGRSSVCFYYALPAPPPVAEPVLILNGEGCTADNPANNVVFLDATSPGYAPEGYSLASVTVVGGAPEDVAVAGDDVALEQRVRKQMERWFGADTVEPWRHLKTYRVPYAQPPQAVRTAGGGGGGFDKPVAVGGGVFVCGDHRASATLNGAVRSGVRAAEAVAAALAVEAEAMEAAIAIGK